MQNNISNSKSKYIVKLAPLALSFYDPISGANLSISRPYFAFDEEPTNAIKNAVKHGKLLDFKGNVLNSDKKTDIPSTTVEKTEIKEEEQNDPQLREEKSKIRTKTK